MDNLFFRVFSNNELEEAAKWARENYKPGQPVHELWHPAVRMECEKMNLEDVQANGRVDHRLD